MMLEEFGHGEEKWQGLVDCVRENCTPVSDGQSGLRVVRVLERLQESLDAGARDAAAR